MNTFVLPKYNLALIFYVTFLLYVQCLILTNLLKQNTFIFKIYDKCCNFFSSLFLRGPNVITQTDQYNLILLTLISTNPMFSAILLRMMQNPFTTIALGKLRKRQQNLCLLSCRLHSFSFKTSNILLCKNDVKLKQQEMIQVHYLRRNLKGEFVNLCNKQRLWC